MYSRCKASQTVTLLFYPITSPYGGKAEIRRLALGHRRENRRSGVQLQVRVILPLIRLEFYVFQVSNQKTCVSLAGGLPFIHEELVEFFFLLPFSIMVMT